MTKLEELLKLVEDEADAKAPANAFKQAMERPVAHLMEELGNDEYAVSTGDKYAVHVKVLGWYIPKTEQ